jgi:cellulose synthase/poly-beta-1,6-N-acetylglucosamine synthase-like glycosyltransferase
MADYNAEREEIAFYQAWLDNESHRRASHYFESARRAFTRQAYHKQHTAVTDASSLPFATLDPARSALHTLTKGQAMTLLLLAAVLSAGLYTAGPMMLALLFGAITLAYFVSLAVTAILAARIMSQATPESLSPDLIHELDGHPWPVYTVLCPLYKEAVVVPQFVAAMQALDYPPDRLQVLFLTESDDEATREAIRSMHLPLHFELVTVPDGQPRTKPRACNYGLLLARGSFIVIYDAEDIPDPLQLKKAVLAFASHNPPLACVQARLGFYNTQQNLLTRWFAIEYALWFDVTLPGLQWARLSLPLGGTSNHFRTDILRRLGGWDVFNVTEDCDLGLRLAEHHLQTRILDSTTLEEANSSIGNWIRQRSRWIKGYMQTYLVHLRRPWNYLRQGRLREFFALFAIVGNTPATFLLNPLMWMLLVLYIAGRQTLTPEFNLLYSAPIFYPAVICLLAGNFLSMYLYLVACTKSKQFGLLPWVFTLPLCWILMSIAAGVALYQLIFKPHHWEKTQHGLHLLPQRVAGRAAAGRTASDLVVEGNGHKSAGTAIRHQGGTIVQQPMPASKNPSPPLDATWFMTMTLPLLPIVKPQKKPNNKGKAPWYHDRWLLALIICASCAGVGAAIWAYQSQTILLYADAHSHLLIARRILDNLYPGLAQFGDVWLPLPHLVMVPLVWNDFLWRTGLAGTFTSMPCYVIACVYVFLTARRLTHDSRASFIGSLVFVLNPNILYLQTTPLSEPVLFATLAAASYYFVVWAQDEQFRDLIYSALATFLATISRYDSWALFLALIVAIVIIDWRKHQLRSKILADVILFASLGGIGIVLWFVWNLVIFGSPTAFLSGSFSSQVLTQSFIVRGFANTYHNLWESLRTYSLATAESIGPVLALLGIVAVILFLRQRRLSSDALAAATTLVPFAFYIAAFFLGQDVMYIPHANYPPFYALYNARFGAEMAAPAAVFIATLVASARRWLPVAEIILAMVIILQSVAISWGGIISLQDGQIGVSCYPSHAIAAFLAQHYDGGRILIDESSAQIDLSTANVDFRNEIYEGYRTAWTAALQNPARYVEWIIAGPHDLVSRHINTQSAAFHREYIPMVSDNVHGDTLWRRTGLPPLPNRPSPGDVLAPFAACSRAKGLLLTYNADSGTALAAPGTILLTGDDRPRVFSHPSLTPAENVSR